MQTDVTVKEIQRQLKQMTSGKAPDESGVVAELLRYSRGEMMLQVVARIFIAVLKPRAAVPDYWKASSSQHC